MVGYSMGRPSKPSLESADTLELTKLVVKGAGTSTQAACVVKGPFKGRNLLPSSSAQRDRLDA
jgi:hypothetical protein